MIKDIEVMYIDSIKSGMQDEIDYRPLFVVYDSNNQMLYASPSQEKPLFLPPSVLSGTISYANVKWHIAGSWSDKKQFRVIVGEFFDNRTTIFGNPAESTAIPLLVTLAAIIVTLLFTAYISLRPLRQIARMISDRKPGTLQVGSGLGLAIAKNLADKIGAQLRVAEGLDERGVGFVIDLPENYLASSES